MATTENLYTGNGATVLYSFTFPYLSTADIKVSVNGTNTTAYTLANATTVQFNAAPANGAAIRIYRVSSDDALEATFYPGSSIRAQDLNDNFTQNLYVTQEANNVSAAATTTANTALTNSNTAISTANSAVSTANTASSNASAAVTTANTASSNASAAVSTANTASSNATTAVNTANAATATANSAASDAATAISTANSAVSTANTASTAASNAVNTANAASSTASSAVSTANTASTNASNAVTTANSAVSTANSAVSTANSAVSTANTAISTANAAASAVANAILYDTVANVAAIPGSPANNDAVEVVDSTGIQSFTPLSGVPVGFVGDAGLSVRLVYTTSGSTWNWIQYFPNDPEARYGDAITTLQTDVLGLDNDKLDLAGGTMTGALTLAGDPTTNLQAATKQYVDAGLSGIAADKIQEGNTSAEVIDTGSDGRFVVTTEGSERLRVDSSGRLGIGSTSDPGGYNARLWIDNTTDSTLTLNTTGSSSLSQLVFRNSNINGEARLMNGTGGSLTFYRSFGNEAARLDTSGRLLIGTTASTGFVPAGESFTTSASQQLSGTSSAGTSAYQATDTLSGDVGIGGSVFLNKRPSNNSGVGNGHTIGSVFFNGWDTSSLKTGAVIRAKSDSQIWASGDCPTRLEFSTTADGASSPTERMRITQGGIISTFTTAGNVGLWVGNGSAAGTSVQLIYGTHSATGTITGTNSFTVWTNGNVVNTNNSYGALSDIKLKENIVDASSQWSDIKALQVRNYNFKEGQTHTQIGLVAQEAELVSPGLVYESPDRDEDGNDLGTVTKSVNYSVLYMKAVKALQEAITRIETLEAKVAALENPTT